MEEVHAADADEAIAAIRGGGEVAVLVADSGKRWNDDLKAEIEENKK